MKTDYQFDTTHAMKRKDKDVDALWSEVKRLTLEMGRLQQQYDEQTACVIVHRGSALACSDAVCAAYYDERRRAERLAEENEVLREALRGWWEARRPVGWTEEMIGIIERLHIKARHRPHEPIWQDALDAIEALRAQAERDEALLRQALDALIWTTGSEDFSEGGLAREGALKLLFPTITALRERLRKQE